MLVITRLTVYSQSCEFLLKHSTVSVEKPERL
jgi:hypothetical protein